MFKKTRRKIVATVMLVLILLWAGTLGVIYGASYAEMKKQNRQMLQAHAQMYVPDQPFDQMLPPNRPMPGGKPGFDPDSPRFQLTTFYSVALSYEGRTLQIRNDPPAVYSDTQLERLAKGILDRGETTGTADNLTYLLTDKGGYVLIVFMDNTVVNESAMTLFRYTLIFGGVALSLFFFLSVYLAGRIVAPLEEGYRKQRQFISDAGHELKTPVSVISANAELLSRALGENQWLQNIQWENQRMGLLVGQLLELSRTENIRIQMEHVDLSRLVAGETLAFESVAFEKGLTLQSSIAGGIAVEGNSAQLRQLAAIVLDNAIRYSSGQVRLTLSRDHGSAQLRVINSGQPIPAEHRERIFERFYRVDPARGGEDKHYGLGLAIAKAIVNNHHGQIGVSCGDGLVEFWIRLPVSKEK